MEYQKRKNLLDNTPNQLSRFKTKNWTEINDQPRGSYNVNSDIRFKTTMLKLRYFNFEPSSKLRWCRARD